MTDDEVTCAYLWKKWEKRDPDLSQVIQTQEKLKTYKKNDWKEMSDDARRVINEISLLIEKDIDINDPRSKDAFQELLNHIEKYFFEPDKDYIDRLENAMLLDKDYERFFNKFKNGLATKIRELIKAYPDKKSSHAWKSIDNTD